MSFEPRDAVDFMRLVAEAESTNRADGLEDLKFSNGDQWPSAMQSSRIQESRPWFTVNKIDAHIRQVANAQRQQRPRIKVHPMDGQADPKIAEVLTGLMRHVEIGSDADNAYDTAFNFVCRIGWGYWRVETDYLREDSFDQDIFIRTIENPFTVYFDPESKLPDGSDAERCLVTDLIPKADFEKQYKGADTSGFTSTATGDVMTDWVTKEDVRIGEYFTVEKERDKLLMLSDGTITYGSKLPDPGILASAGVSVTGSRESWRRKVMWRKVTAFDVLESEEMMGRWIPIIPAYGDSLIIAGRRQRFGMVRNARDPQRLYNYWRTAMAESVAMAPKAKWLMREGQDEGHENEWNRANVSAVAVLRYVGTDADGREAPAPERVQPEPPPSGAMEMAESMGADLQAVLGMYDPSMGKPSGPKSGTAIRAEQGQSEMSNFHFYDNLVRSIKHSGRVILDLIPKVYDQKRIVRIVGDDGRPDLVTVNEPGQPDATGAAINQILNDVTVGTYDIVMDVGQSFNSKRAEAVDSLTQMVSGNPDLMHIAGDLIFRNMDFPGADVIADRLAAANPMAQLDEKSDVPPQAQMQIKQLQQHLQQTTQQLQQATQVIKSRSDIEQMKQDGETKREHMRVTVKAHDTETWAQEERDQFESVERTRERDTHVRAMTAINVAEINHTGALLAKRMDAQQAGDEAREQRRQQEVITHPAHPGYSLHHA